MTELSWFQRIGWRGFTLFIAIYLACSSPIWFLVRQTESLGPLDREADRVLGLMTVATLVAAAAAWFIVQQYIARRISAAQRMLAGSVADERAFTDSPDEIVEFAEAVRESVDSLRTELVRLETEKGRLSALLNGMGEAVVVLDVNERVVLANPVAERLLRFPDEYETSRLAEVCDSERVMAVASEVLWSKEPQNEDLDFHQRDDVKHLSLSASPIMAGKRVVGAVLLLYDVTRLRRLERVRRDFVANVSHELRTPIAAIQSTAETLLMADLPIDDVMVDFLQTIERNAQRMGNIVTDLLTLSRLEAEGTTSELYEVELTSILHELMAHVEPIARKKGVELILDVDPELPSVLGDEVALRQALENLVENGIKYTPEGGKVTLRARLKGKKRLRVDVIDTGFGIPREHLPRIFERFYRVDVGRSREVGGTGLGLAIVKHLIRNMLGRIAVESEEGKGTTFKVWLRIFDPKRADR